MYTDPAGASHGDSHNNEESENEAAVAATPKPAGIGSDTAVISVAREFWNGTGSMTTAVSCASAALACIAVNWEMV